MPFNSEYLAQAKKICEDFNNSPALLFATPISSPVQGVKIFYLKETTPPAISQTVIDKGLCILLAAVDKEELNRLLDEARLNCPCAPFSFFHSASRPLIAPSRSLPPSSHLSPQK